MVSGGAGVVHDTEVIYGLARNNGGEEEGGLSRSKGGLGDFNMNVDGSVTPQEFDIFADNDLYIARATIRIIDNGITPIKFGGINILPNGIEIFVADPDGVPTVDFLDGERIKTNAAFSILAGAAEIFTSSAGDDLFGANWEIGQSLGAPLYIPIRCKLRFRINDDLTDISEFAIMAQGHT